MNSAISDTSAAGIGRAATSAGFISSILSTLERDDPSNSHHVPPLFEPDPCEKPVPGFSDHAPSQTSGSRWLPAPQPRVGAATCLRESLHCVVWGPVQSRVRIPLP